MAKTNHRFYKSVFNRIDNSLECFNRATHVYIFIETTGQQLSHVTIGISILVIFIRNELKKNGFEGKIIFLTFFEMLILLYVIM